MNGLRLGIDLGTSSVKVVLLTSDGRVLANGEAGYPTVSDLPGQAEQDPAEWLDALGAAVQKFGEAAPGGWQESVAAVGLAGQLPTLVCLGADGPVGRAITWQDSRADDWVGKLIDDAMGASLYRATGMPIDGRYLGPLFRYHKWGQRDEITAIISAKDYLAYALTGRVVTDPSTASGYAAYGLADGAWGPELSAMWDVPPSLLPQISASGEMAGKLHAEGARLLGLPKGIAVFVGCADSVAGALAIFAYVSGHAQFANYLLIPHLPGTGELIIFCGSLVGAGLGFLWFNTYPAQVFMGDVGALALGAALGVVSVIVRQEIVLFIMGGVFVMETVSVILQVASFRLTGRRIFRMAPLHHHFELKGWPEPRVIVRFWVVTVVLVLIGLASLKIR